MYDGEVTAHILAISDAGSLIPMCAWCGRVRIDEQWVEPPRAALAAIDVVNTVSHTICPECAAKQTRRAST